MKNNLITDIKSAVALFKDMQRARRRGYEIEIKCTQSTPFIDSEPSFYDTVEGCTLSHLNREIVVAAQNVFRELPYEKKT